MHKTPSRTSPRTLNSGTALPTPRTALIVAGVVLCFGLLWCYVHLLQTQVKRGETFRAAQRAGLPVLRDGSMLRSAQTPSAPAGPQLASASPR